MHGEFAGDSGTIGPARPVLLKTLPPVRQTTDSCEYLDVEEERPGQSARIYIFGVTLNKI
jgi:hypothetical protein